MFTYATADASHAFHDCWEIHFHFAGEMQAMAEDPDIQREVTIINREFAPSEADGLGDAVVGADDRGVAPAVATADVLALEDGDVADAVIASEVVGQCQTVNATADDHYVVAIGKLSWTPERRPPLPKKAAAQQPEGRVARLGVLLPGTTAPGSVG